MIDDEFACSKLHVPYHAMKSILSIRFFLSLLLSFTMLRQLYSIQKIIIVIKIPGIICFSLFVE
ncbi:hypothetical protein QBC43DRAFT_317602 [Cladorrhinum sp. PSN259]|nr:hypothetical protein QBC43DRAFT_317602 [Cladorrhinum sp. PSN259]